MAWNCTGRKLASGSVDRTLRIWDIHHGKGDKAEAELKGHTEGVDQVCWHPSHQDQLATASGDKSVRFWCVSLGLGAVCASFPDPLCGRDTRSGKCVAPVTTAGENINLAWSPDGRHVAVGDRGDCVTVLDVRTHRAVGKNKFPFEVNEFCWDAAGTRFFITSGHGSVEVLSYPSWEALHCLVAHTAGNYCLDISPGGGLLAVGSGDALVSLWDVGELCCVRTLARLDKPIRALSFSHDGRFLAAGSQDHYIDVSVAATGEQACRMDTRAELHCLAWNPRYLVLAYATGDETHTDAEGQIYERGRGEGMLRVWGVS